MLKIPGSVLAPHMSWHSVWLIVFMLLSNESIPPGLGAPSLYSLVSLSSLRLCIPTRQFSSCSPQKPVPPLGSCTCHPLHKTLSCLSFPRSFADPVVSVPYPLWMPGILQVSLTVGCPGPQLWALVGRQLDFMALMLDDSSCSERAISVKIMFNDGHVM